MIDFELSADMQGMKDMMTPPRSTKLLTDWVSMSTDYSNFAKSAKFEASLTEGAGSSANRTLKNSPEVWKLIPLRTFQSFLPKTPWTSVGQ